MTSLGVSLDKIRFVRGSAQDMHELSKIDGVQVVKHKQSDHPILSGVLYPGLHALNVDEQYVGVDAQFGQQMIFAYGYAEKYLAECKKTKMFSSEVALGNKIDLLDSPQQVNKKLKKAFWESGNIVFCPYVSLSFSRSCSREKTL